MTNDICNNGSLTDQEKWHKIVGTDSYGNLPEHKVSQHEGHCYAKCPYSTQSTDLRTRMLLNLAVVDALPAKVLHEDENGKEYFMKTDIQGSWGYTCTFSGCPHLLDEGFNYFYM